MTREESVRETRLWFFDNAIACIEAALAREDRVNNLESYIAWREDTMVATLNGEGDHSFAFEQRRHFIQTGECVPFFPPRSQAV